MPAPSRRSAPASTNEDPSAAIERLRRACKPIGGTPAEKYLHARGIRGSRFPSLRHHPKLYYRDDNFTGAFPALVAAALSAAGVGAFAAPASRRVAIARDNDPDCIQAADRLAEHCGKSGIVCRVLIPRGNDFNDDLGAYGPRSVRCRLGSPWSA